jgi:hypothetical protein
MLAMFSIHFGFFLFHAEKYVERMIFFLSFPIWLAFMLFQAFLGYRQRSPMLKLFVLSWSALLAGSAVFMLMIVGFLPRNLYTTSALLVGSAIEFILLSLALAMRINLLQAQTRADQEVQIKTKVRQAEILGLESQHRQRQASSFAHYINNPLNQLVLNQELLKTNTSQVYSLIQSLLPEDTEDHEVKSIRGRFNTLFSNVNLSLTELDSAVSRITRSVAEVRSVSGIDGAKIEEVKICKLMFALKRQLSEMLATKDFERVELIMEDIPESFSLYSDFFLLKNGLEQFLLSLILKLQDRLTIRCSEGPDRTLVLRETLGLVGKGEMELFTEALFASLQNNLYPAGIESVMSKEGYFLSIRLKNI